jgi:hypothetical protein
MADAVSGVRRWMNEQFRLRHGHPALIFARVPQKAQLGNVAGRSVASYNVMRYIRI